MTAVEFVWAAALVIAFAVLILAARDADRGKR